MKPSSKSITQEERCHRNQTKKTLENEFRRISCAAIDTVLQLSEFNFTAAYHFLSKIEDKRGTIYGGGDFQLDGFPVSIKVFIKKDRAEKEFQLTDKKLIGETDAIPKLKLHTKKKNPPTVMPVVVEETRYGTIAIVEAEMECLCCYGDYPRSDMRECKAGSDHFICKQCIYCHVSEQLDGNDSAVFKCIGDANCRHEYSIALLNQTLTPKLNRRANDRIFREEMKKAGVDVWTCPECAHIGFTDGNFPWIHCPECDIKYCTGCNEIFHKNQTCLDVRRAKERLKDPKHRAHEAMSQACKRFCPHCKQEYMKGDGCNKITCKCKKLSCYLCGEKVPGYSHFCGCRNKCSCGKKCRLFTSTQSMESVDQRKRQEAGRKVLVEAGITDEKNILSILASPPKKKQAAAAPKPHDIPVPHQPAGAPAAVYHDPPVLEAAAAPNLLVEPTTPLRNPAVRDPVNLHVMPPAPVAADVNHGQNLVVFVLLACMMAVIFFFAKLHNQMMLNMSSAVVYSQDLTWDDGTRMNTLTIYANEEPADKVYRFLQENNINKHFPRLIELVCGSDEVSCNRLEPMTAAEGLL